MSEKIEHFIEEIVSLSKVSGHQKDNLRKELYSHIYDEQRELQLQGHDENKVFEEIKLKFGNTFRISKELHIVHTNLTREDWVLRGVLFFSITAIVITFIQQIIRCAGPQCLPGVPMVSLFSPLVAWLALLVVPFNKFSLVFLASNAGFVFVCYGILWIVKRYIVSAPEPKKIVSLIFSLALVLNFLSVFLSERLVNYPANFNPTLESTYSVAGFPLKVFDYPFSPMGNDQVPLYMWKNFYLNYAFWFLVSLFGYALIPKKIKNNSNMVITIALMAGAVTLYSLAWILLQFD